MVDDLDLYRFIEIHNTQDGYSFWIGKYPVTNAQYARFLDAPDYSTKEFWIGFPRFDEMCQQNGNWKDEGWQWLQENGGERIEPRLWKDDDYGMSNPENPVVGISWYAANAYCKWLLQHWQGLTESHANQGLRPRLVRLPLDTEWAAAAGGEKPEGRYPWDLPGQATTDIEEILKRANVERYKVGHTTPVNTYPDGKSPYGVMDMAGNAWEWQANFYEEYHDLLSLRGGSWNSKPDDARVSIRGFNPPVYLYSYECVRVVAFPE